MKLVLTAYVSKRRTVEFIPVHAPLRHEPVHQISKTMVVTILDQVNRFVHKDVLQARSRLLGQFDIDGVSALRKQSPEPFPTILPGVMDHERN